MNSKAFAAIPNMDKIENIRWLYAGTFAGGKPEDAEDKVRFYDRLEFCLMDILGDDEIGAADFICEAIAEKLAAQLTKGNE